MRTEYIKTYFILNVLHPMANDVSWCPRQIPNTGLNFSSDRTWPMLAIVDKQFSGSPGPLLRKRPS
jgi:hypothetical protein